MPAVRPRFHLTPCSKFRGHLSSPEQKSPSDEVLFPTTQFLRPSLSSRRVYTAYMVSAASNILSARARRPAAIEAPYPPWGYLLGYSSVLVGVQFCVGPLNAPTPRKY